MQWRFGFMIPKFIPFNSKIFQPCVIFIEQVVFQWQILCLLRLRKFSTLPTFDGSPDSLETNLWRDRDQNKSNNHE